MWLSSTASLRLAGSLSEPLATTTARRRRRGDRAQLQGAGDVRAAAPAQAAVLDGVEQPGAGVAAGRLQRAVDAHVLGEGQRATALDPAQEPRKAALGAHHATSCAAAVPTTAPLGVDPERQAQLHAGAHRAT